jgi:hypothetical protein
MARFKKKASSEYNSDNIDSNLEFLDETFEKKDSKHKEYKKHSLKHDSIFKGKKDPKDQEESYINETITSGIDLDPTSSDWTESRQSQDHLRKQKLVDEVYKIIKNKIGIDPSKSRRKPGPADFNINFQIIKESLKSYNFTICELFVEYSQYFSDNLASMFKMLDKREAMVIIKELEEYRNVGKQLDDIDFV